MTFDKQRVVEEVNRVLEAYSAAGNPDQYRQSGHRSEGDRPRGGSDPGDLHFSSGLTTQENSLV